jgi:peptide/nickel transport system substrate-binding protein
LLVGVALAACGGGTTTTGTTRVADPNGTFKFRYQIDPNTFDPALNNATYGPEEESIVYDTLIKLNPDGSYAPSLVTEWSYVDTNTSLQLKLRKGVTFTDGTPWNAAALKGNLDRDKSIKGGTVASELNAIASIEVVDELTAKLHLVSGLGGTLLDPLSNKAGYMASPAAYNNPDYGKNPVGTGPFKLVSWKPGVQMLFDRNESYWGHKPGAAHLELDRIPDDQAAVNAIKTGQVDAMRSSASLLGPLYTDLKATSGITVKKEPTLDIIGFDLNANSNKAFDDLRVRQAISYGIDRDALRKSVGLDTTVPTEQIARPESRYYNQQYKGFYAYNPTKAKQLLADAGHASDLTMEIITNLTSQENLQDLQIIQQQFQKIGITLKIRQLDSASILPQCYTALKCDGVFGNYSNRADSEVAINQWHSANAFLNTGHPAPGGGREVPPALAPLMKLADAATTEAEHTKRVQAVVGAECLDVGHVWLYGGQNISITRPTADLPLQIIGGGAPDWSHIAKYK